MHKIWSVSSSCSELDLQLSCGWLPGYCWIYLRAKPVQNTFWMLELMFWPSLFCMWWFSPCSLNPSFSAYTNDPKYVSYTYECQACKNTNVLAVRNGACSCSFIKCSSKVICQDGQCVSQTPVQTIDKCTLIKCGFGTFCRNSQSVSVKPNLCLQQRDLHSRH